MADSENPYNPTYFSKNFTDFPDFGELFCRLADIKVPRKTQGTTLASSAF